MASAEYPTAMTVEDFTSNLRHVHQRIDAARGRSPFGQPVRLLPVSKTVPEDRVALAIEAGCTELGENKAQEAYRKWQALGSTGVTWSVIGHLQTNKAKLVAEFSSEFQALDSLRLAEALDRRLQGFGRGLDVFVQVNTSAEDTKFGIAPEDLEGFLSALVPFTSLRVRGLMTLAVFSADAAKVRRCFALLRQLRDQARQTAPSGMQLDDLSMGMSGDYELAIAEGATVVRVGQAIFGSRSLPNDHYWPPST